jgi:hypothetical protein
VEPATGEAEAALRPGAEVSPTPDRGAHPVQLRAVPGRSVDQLFGRPAVQRRVSGPAPDGQDVHAAAARGIAGASTALPFADRIQAGFGSGYDVSSIQAHVGGPAGEAASAMGASAYATGNHVVFGGAPDLHTAAHEAAHVVQQRHGVQLYGGVGEAGDAHERHADAVADVVVAGASAAPLLDQYGGGAPRRAVQRAIKKPGETTHYTVDEVRLTPWYAALGSVARQQHIERLVNEPAEQSNLSVDEALVDVDRAQPKVRPATISTQQAAQSERLASESDDWFAKMSQPQPVPLTGSTHPQTSSSPALRPPAKQSSSQKPKVERLDSFAWSDDEDEEPKAASTPMQLGLTSRKTQAEPTTARKPMSLGLTSRKPQPEPKGRFSAFDDDAPKPFGSPMSGAPSHRGSSSNPGKPIRTAEPMTGGSRSAVDLCGGSPVATDGKDDGKGFIREGGEGSQVWAISTTESTAKIGAEYDGLALMRAHHVPTVLAGELSAVRTKRGTTQGYPMHWIANGISSNSATAEFKAELEKLSGAKLEAAKQDMAVIQGFLTTYVVQDFQAILDPLTGHIYVNDPRYCRDRKLGEKSADQERLATWTGLAGSKPSSASTGEQIQ